MNFKISFITASLFAALSLSGCNGGSSSTSTSPVDKKPSPDKETPDTSKPDTGTITIQAIDGYLANAEICIDRNNNSSCDTDEKLTIKTDKNGKKAVKRWPRGSPDEHPRMARTGNERPQATKSGSMKRRER